MLGRNEGGPRTEGVWSLRGSDKDLGTASVAPVASFPKCCALVLKAGAKRQSGQGAWVSEGRPVWAPRGGAVGDPELKMPPPSP